MYTTLGPVIDIIDHDDNRYELLAHIPFDVIGEDFDDIKKSYKADIVFRKNGHYFFCREIQEAEFEDIVREQIKDS